MDIETFYRVFRDISTLVHASTSLKEVLNLIVWKSTDVLGAKGALLRIRNLDTQQFEVGAVYGLAERYLLKGPVSSEKIFIKEIQQNRVLVIEDLWNAPRVEYPQEAWDEGIRMILDVPLTLGTQMIGIIRIYLSQKRKFTEEELDFLISIAGQCACAINKARLIETQREEYNHLAKQTEKLSALGRMAAGIAHEINNPLAGILLYSTNMQKKVPEESPLKNSLDIIIQETIRCKDIIQELLEFSRDRDPKKEPANINDIIEKALSILSNELSLRHIIVDKQLSGGVKRVMLDKNMIQQVFVNLLINAVHAIGEKGRVCVRCEMDSSLKNVIIEVSDTGSGISSENLSKVFEPFFSTKFNGTGLGLAVSYGIIRNHQGNMSVTSQPGKGTCFKLEIPVVQ